MASIVMRVRLTSGDHTDVTYEDGDARDEAEVIEAAVTTLGRKSGILRCGHGDRQIVARTVFWNISWCKIYCYAFLRQV